MATSSIQAFNGGALNGGLRPEDLQPLRVLTQMQSEPAAEYTPDQGADWIQRAVVFKDQSDTVTAVYRPFGSDDTEITIPDNQEQSDWDEADCSKPSFIKNKPTIPAEQVQSDWAEADSTAADYIKNKPTIPAAQVQSDWSQADNTKVDYIKNKPTIPAPQIQSDWNQADNTKLDYIKNKPTIPPVVLMTALWDSDAGDYRYPAISDIDDAWDNNKDVILVRYTPANSRNYWRLVSTASNSYKFANVNPDNAHQSILVAKKVGGTDTWTETDAGQWGHWINTSTWRVMLSLSVEMHLETAPTLDDGSGFYQETDLEDEVFEAGVYHFDMEIAFNRQNSSLTTPVMYDMTVKVGTSTVFTTSMTFQGKWGGANAVNETAQISGIIKVPSSGKLSVNLLWGGGDNTLDNNSRLKMSHLFLRKLYI